MGLPPLVGPGIRIAGATRRRNPQYFQDLILMICEFLLIPGLISIDLTGLPSALSGFVSLSHLSDPDSLPASVVKMVQ